MAEQVVSMIEEMRENGESMRLWKNVELSVKCIERLNAIDDASELEKALVCSTILDLIPKYDVPRYALSILHRQKEWLENAGEETEYLTLESIGEEIDELEDYIDYGRMSNEEFMGKYSKFLKFDPICRTEMWEENYCRWEQECDRRLGDTPRGMGFCFEYWSTFAAVLAEEGVEWKSPSRMNPRVMFD